MPKIKLKNELHVDEWKCKYCSKTFRRETTLSTHLCVKKQRMLDSGNTEARLAFRVYQHYMITNTSAKTPPSLESFIDSKFYIDFAKFGRYLRDLSPLYIEKFIDFVIKSGVSIDNWRHEDVYEAYLLEILYSEDYSTAMTRSLSTMQTWAENNNKEIFEYFTLVNLQELVYSIKTGYISPWMLYLSGTGQLAMKRMLPEHIIYLNRILNTDNWSFVFKSKVDDVKFVVSTMDAYKL